MLSKGYSCCSGKGLTDDGSTILENGFKNLANNLTRAFTLTQSVYGWLDRRGSRTTLLKLNIAGKVISVLLPIVQIALQQVVALQRSYVGYMILCNALC
jgi:hypothetical protein